MLVINNNPLPPYMDVKKIFKGFRNTLKSHSDTIAVKKLDLILMQDEGDFEKKEEIEKAIRKNEKAMRSLCRTFPEVGKIVYVHVCENRNLPPIELDIIKYYPGCFGEELRRQHRIQLDMKEKTEYAYILCFIILNYLIMYYCLRAMST